MEDEDEYLTVKEICTRLRVTRGTVRRMITGGLLDAVKTNPGRTGRVRIPVASYESFLREQTVKAST